MSEMTIEQRREEIRRQQDELQRQEAELARKAREEREAKIRQERDELNRRIMDQKLALATKISAQILYQRPNLVFTLTADRFQVAAEHTSFGDYPFSCYIEVNQKYDRGGYYRKEVPGVYDIVVGNYGDKVRFPAKKDGSHSYDKIATDILGRYDAAIASHRREQARKANEQDSAPAAAALREEFGLSEYSSWSPRKSAAVGCVDIYLPNRNLALSPENARKLLSTLREIGVIN